MYLPDKPFFKIREILGDKNNNPPIKAVFPVGRTTWYAGIKTGIYPKPVYLGARNVAWARADLERLLQDGTLKPVERVKSPYSTRPEKPKIASQPNPVTKQQTQNKRINVLREEVIAEAPIRARIYKLFDGGGLFMEIHPRGSKYWRIKYKHAGRVRCASLGVYPEVSLSQARVNRDAWRALVKAGENPLLAKKEARVKEQLHDRQNARLNELNAQLLQFFTAYKTLDQKDPIACAVWEAQVKAAHQMIYTHLWNAFVNDNSQE
jgi:predicted DNA-binding transcriptional regulator AlpA